MMRDIEVDNIDMSLEAWPESGCSPARLLLSYA